MKYSILTYHLLAILCMMATSCVTDGVMDNRTINTGQTEFIEGGTVNFALNFPTASTRAIQGQTDGLINERTIKDVQIYTFVNNQFVEKVKYILISGTNGDVTRHVEGKLSEVYAVGSPMDFVVIVNAESKGVSPVEVNQGDSKTALYTKLVYTFNRDKDWSKDIPMWGEGTIASIQTGDYNIGKLTLKRAIAKVNITVNDGNGLDNFKITKANLHNYNNGGYCAPFANGEPSIPPSVTPSGDIISTSELNESERNRIENKFYIPEHKNVEVAENEKVYLTIEAIMNGQTKSYIIPFKESGKDYNVLRNYIYVFNITSVKTDVPIEATLKYEVKVWEEETIDIPAFD